LETQLYYYSFAILAKISGEDFFWRHNNTFFIFQFKGNSIQVNTGTS